jgi:hypothetical protein
MNVFSKVAVISLIAFMPAAAVSQESSASIGGTVYGLDGETVSDAPIQISNTVTDEYWRARSDPNGEYRMTGVPAGSYQLSINTPLNSRFGSYRPYKSEIIEVGPGEASVLDANLEQSGSLGTIGDDIAAVSAVIRARQDIPDLPVPRMSDANPDFSGVWLIGSSPYPQKADAFPWAQEIFEERASNRGRNSPHTQCLPGAAPTPRGGGSPFIIKIVQKPELMVVLLEDLPGYRQIFVDGRAHPEDPNPSWVGHSAGRWEGDVLVVDTVGYNDRGWMNRYPRTEDLHIVERYTRTEYGRMMVEVTIEDPTVFKKPWVQNVPMDLAPQEELFEYVCENNKWAQAAEN